MTTTLDDTIHQYLTQAPTSELRGARVEVVAGWEGREHLLWRVRAEGRTGGVDAVLKLYLDAGQARSRRQYDGQQIFALLGLAPQPLWYDRYPEGLARQILVYRWAPGEVLAPAEPDQLAAMARAAAQVHQADPSQVRRFSPNPVNLAYLWQLLENSAAQAQKWLQQQPAPRLADFFNELHRAAAAAVQAGQPLWQGVAATPVHGDLRLENTLHHLGQVTLLDWEQFGLGDAGLDAARFLHHSRDGLDHGQISLWLDHYLDAVQEPDAGPRIALYRQALLFQDVCYLLNGVRDLAADPTGLEPAEREPTLAFLAETLTAALDASATALGVDGRAAGVETLFGGLFDEMGR